MTIAAVILDWAGTAVDFGSLGPMVPLKEAFAAHGVPISIEEVRIDCGLGKEDHIRALGELPRIKAAWKAKHGNGFASADLAVVYKTFLKLQIESVASRSTPIPGTLDMMATLKRKNIPVGSTTGYPRAVMEKLAPAAASKGFSPASIVCVDDVKVGRPTPLMIYKSMLDLNVWPSWACVKVDDTVPGIEEGKQAGCWTVAVSKTGNALGLDEDELANLSASRRAELTDRAHQTLGHAKPNFIIDGVADLQPVLDEISARIEAGDRPPA